MRLTIEQIILQELEAHEPVTTTKLQSHLKDRGVEISLVDTETELNKLVGKTWVEYYELIGETELGYELCNRWYNYLTDAERIEILTRAK